MTLEAAHVEPDESLLIRRPFSPEQDETAVDLPAGLHELLPTTDLRDRLASIPSAVPSLVPVDKADEPHVLARHIQALTQRALENTNSASARVRLVNALVELLAANDEHVVEPTSQLTRLVPVSEFEAVHYPDVRPSTPLSESALLTNSRASRASQQNFAPSWTPRTRSTFCAPL